MSRLTARSRLAGEAVEVLNDMAPTLKTIIHHRQLFASSMIDGRTAGELDPRSSAAKEISALWQEIHSYVHNYITNERSIYVWRPRKRPP